MKDDSENERRQPNQRNHLVGNGCNKTKVAGVPGPNAGSGVLRRNAGVLLDDTHQFDTSAFSQLLGKVQVPEESTGDIDSDEAGLIPKLKPVPIGFRIGRDQKLPVKPDEFPVVLPPKQFCRPHLARGRHAAGADLADTFDLQLNSAVSLPNPSQHLHPVASLQRGRKEHTVRGSEPNSC